MQKAKKTFQYGPHTVTLETGEVARQASGAVVARMGDTVVLVAVVGMKEAVEGRDFFPLTVNYQERGYSAGKIPGGFFKREGRPTVKEVLTSRLIDRPLRPLFPAGFNNEVQVVATVMSLDPEIDADVVSLLGASAALAIAGIPFNGPLAAARVGYKEGQYLLNPTQAVLKDSALDLVVAGTQNAVLMVESEAKELSEEVMLGAVLFGHREMQTALQAIRELARDAGAVPWGWVPPAMTQALRDRVTGMARDALVQAYQIRDKQERQSALAATRKQVITALCTDETGAPSEESIKNMLGELEEGIVRGRILDGLPRIDGRDTTSVRPIEISLTPFPRPHGSAIFTRGETQAVVATTLGTERDAQIIDDPAGEYRESFMLHYNFPPYCVGEVGMMGSPKRREIGHGNLARRALRAMLPSKEQFPYVLRVVSEITESNGSSSMATVCGTSLALMDAGVPIKAPVAGIAMGLIKEGDRYAVLSDILGDEDHLGDMDFKVAGTAEGVTALQMDIKIDGITAEIMERALHQAKAGRLHILAIMRQAIDKPRPQISVYAPRIITFTIPTDRIRDVIGKGGVTIRELVEQTKTEIDISDDGVVTIAAVDTAAGEEARRRIEALTADAEVGKIYEGKVVKIMEFGAFVNILPGKDGLLHVSQIAHERVRNVADHVHEGQKVRVKVLEVDRQGKIRLSMKDVESA